MNSTELSKIVSAAKCRVFGADDAPNDAHRLVLALVIQSFDNSESAVLCEPSIVRSTKNPPDVVLVDPEVGVHVFEVKGVSLDHIEGIEPGGQFQIRYDNGGRKNPFNQARNFMFDIKDATGRAFDGELQLPFKYWVAMPLIRRTAWHQRWGEDVFCPQELLFVEDLESSHLARRLGATDRASVAAQPIQLQPLDQLQCVWKAFGDTSVLYARPEDRQARKTAEGTLGERFDEAAEAYKTLSDEQQKLSEQNWTEGPRLVRGVAGSGKTIVLANNLARRLQRAVGTGDDLFATTRSAPRILTVCFNRTLVPFLKKKIGLAYQQRTGKPLPESAVEVFAFNKLMFHLSKKGLWRYQKFGDAGEVERSAQYLKDLLYTKQNSPAVFEAGAYDAVYVDEGQDFLEEDFRLLKELCRTPNGAEPNLYVFYDDAQNLYARNRPNWQSVGVNIRGGRSHIMKECFRNTKAIVEATFNVLYGTCASASAEVPSKEFGDIKTLENHKLIQDDRGFWRVKFARREGLKPLLSFASGTRKENELLVSRLRWLIEKQEVRPQDIQVLTHSKDRVWQLADAVSAAKIPGVTVHVAIHDDLKDRPLGEKGRLTISTVASSKGYDAYCVLLASANDFPVDVKGRVTFYVGCTRAIEYLEVLASERRGLAVELEAAIGRL